MSFLFHCPPLYVPFPCFAVLSLVSLFFFFLVFLPPVRGFLSRFRLPKISLSLSVSWLPFSPWFLPSVRGFLFSLASSVSLRRNRGMQVCYSSSFFLLQFPPLSLFLSSSLSVFFCLPPSFFFCSSFSLAFIKPENVVIKVSHVRPCVPRSAVTDLLSKRS